MFFMAKEKGEQSPFLLSKRYHGWRKNFTIRRNRKSRSFFENLLLSLNPITLLLLLDYVTLESTKGEKKYPRMESDIMIITKYAVGYAPLKDSVNGAFDESALLEVLTQDSPYTIHQTEESAFNFICENGFDPDDTYIIPLTIDISQIKRIEVSIKPAFNY